MDLQSGKLEKVQFPFPYPDPSQNQPNIVLNMAARPRLFDLKNGDIALTYYNYLNIVDTQTLAVKQVLQGRDIFDNVRQILTFHDETTNQTRYYVCRLAYTCMASELIKQPSEEYKAVMKQYIFDDSIWIDDSPYKTYMTSLDSAVFLRYCSIRYLKISDSIIGFSADRKYFLKERQKVAVSHDESFFVLRNAEGGFEFYNFGEDYEPTLYQTISISNEYNLLKGATSADDRFLFLSFSAGDRFRLAKVDIAKGQYTFLTDHKGNLSQVVYFHLLDAKYDVMVTVEEIQYHYYMLQLRKVSDMSVVQQMNLYYQFPIDCYKLIGSFEWGLTFGLAIKTKITKYDLESDGILLLYKIQGDKLIAISISQDITFDTLFAVSKYVVTYKNNFPAIRVFHFSNLSLATTIPSTINNANIRSEDISYEKDILMLKVGYEVYFYNFSHSLGSIGSILTGEFRYDEAIYLHVVFPTRQILYVTLKYFDYNYFLFYTAPATKMVFNISQLPIYKTVKMQELKNGERCDYAAYIIPKQAEEKCNYVLYLTCVTREADYQCIGRKLVKYYECNDTKDEYPIDYKDQIQFSRHYISSDEKYVIIILRPYQRREFSMEIRPIGSLNTTYFQRVFGYSEGEQYYLSSQYKVDIIQGKNILIQGPNFITLYKIKQDKYKEAQEQHAYADNDKTCVQKSALPKK